MRKRVLKDWMGEDWTVKQLPRIDKRLKGATACLDGSNNTIYVIKADPNTMITSLIHEAMHIACRLDGTSPKKKETDEELQVEYATQVILQFLKKMGVDLSPLIS
jgi:hypothetical protein